MPNPMEALSESHGCTFNFLHLIFHYFLNKTFAWLCVKLGELWTVKMYNLDSNFTIMKSFFVTFLLWTISLSEKSLLVHFSLKILTFSSIDTNLSIDYLFCIFTTFHLKKTSNWCIFMFQELTGCMGASGVIFQKVKFSIQFLFFQ